jgi:glutamate racemase
MPVVGVEPGLKPAAAATRNGKVGVLATERTLKPARNSCNCATRSRAPPAREFLLQPCHGLVDQIELGDLEAPAIGAMLEPLHRAAAGRRRRYAGAGLHPLSAGAGGDRGRDRPCAAGRC